MDTFKTAFDMIVVGALALPWVLLLLDLYLPIKTAEKTTKQTLENLSPTLQFVNDAKLSAVAGVLLFAVAYVMGAGISRMSGDALNDDDFGLFRPVRHLLPTTDKIAFYVYCGKQGWLVDPCPCIKDQAQSCPFGSWSRPSEKQWCALLLQSRRVFEYQEAALLNAGEQTPERMSHIYQQVVILRGAVLDGLVLSLLLLLCCLQKRYGPKVVGAVCAGIILWWSLALWRHVSALNPWEYLAQPPMLEICIIVIVLLSGFAFLRNGVPNHRFCIGFVVASAMTFLAYVGWWWTEIVYDELVLNLYVSHQALSH
ncbi:MAG TPA: hypothetical protein VF753_04695 [Terriglobales bacterium]